MTNDELEVVSETPKKKKTDAQREADAKSGSATARQTFPHAAITGGHVLTALSDARGAPRLRSLLAENAHPVKR